jgi:hypothetical protein
MKTNNNNHIILKYLNEEMSMDEISEFEQLLKENKELQREFLIERAILSAIRENGRQKTKDRISRIRTEEIITTTPRMSMPDEAIYKLGRRAAFMLNQGLNITSLPVSDDTINEFLSDDNDIIEHSVE